MKITVLADNNTIIDRYFLGEPGVSFFIEECGRNVIFDVGYSDVFIRNAQRLNINMYDIDFVAISHGHIDHTWGLAPLISLYSEALIEKLSFKKPVLIAHEEAFSSKYYENEVIGSIVTEKTLRDYFKVNLRVKPFWITEKLVFLGEIERTNNFENKKPIGRYMHKGIEEDDFLIDDTALVYKSNKGLVIITGCSHSGICNIIEYAKKICNDNRVADIIGGLHLLKPDIEQMDSTKKYIKETNVEELHACHCTDLHSKIALSEVTEVNEVGVGLKLEYE
ncbi:MAG: MBL fold metallo-hydrolase [Clostridia bacterium BRH_c25]|nr:MAG: MBL fold metallo-hydrolase [Clostridia bacterium BRH_c25]